MTRTPPVDQSALWNGPGGQVWVAQQAILDGLFQPMADLLVAELPETVTQLLDVGCGTGASLLASAAARPATHSTGLDISAPMLALARQRAEAAGLDADFIVADAQRHPLPSAHFDWIQSRLGVMFFNDPPAAFANLRRWLVPGGHFAFAVWGPVADNVWMTATRAAVAEVINLAPIDLLAPGPFRYGDVVPLLALLGRVGFVDVTATDWRQTLPIGDRLSASDAAQFALASFSSFAELLSKAGGDAPNRARRALVARFTAYEHEGAVLMPARVHIITGRAAEP